MATMQWDDLFADLQAQWDAQVQAEDDALVAELAEAEVAGTRFADRMRARHGERVNVRLADGSDNAGTVTDAAMEWVVLADGDRRHLIPVAAIAAAWPLAGSAPTGGTVERTLGLGHVLRALANDGAPVVVRHRGGEAVGYVVRVGADHLDLQSPAGPLTIPWTGLLRVSSR